MNLYQRKIDLTDKYNYTLNGIEHQIPLHNIKIQTEPIHDKILISNKFLIKYLHDIFVLNNIEYFVSYHTLLGYYIFEGVHLFKKNIYLCIPDHHLNKLKKLKEVIEKDDFIFEEKEEYINIRTSFFDKIMVNAFIFIVQNDENKKLKHKIENIESNNDFYDIYPLQLKKYEEFDIFIPNKIENVLKSYSFNLNSIIFVESNEKEKEKENKYQKNLKEDKNIFHERLEENNDFRFQIKTFFNQYESNSLLSKFLSSFNN